MRLKLKAMVATLAVGASLLAAGTAQANQYHPVNCKVVAPGFVKSLTASHVSCATARAVVSYVIGHEIYRDWTRIAGYWWGLSKFSSGHGLYTTIITTGAPRLGAPTVVYKSLPYG